jgi:hypothetical protein
MGTLGIVDQDLGGGLPEGLVLLDRHKVKGLPATRPASLAIGGGVWGLVAVTSRPVSLNRRRGRAISMRVLTSCGVIRVIEAPRARPAGLLALECGDSGRVEWTGETPLEDGLGVLAVPRGGSEREVQPLVVGASQGLSPKSGGDGFSVGCDLHDRIESVPAREGAHQKPRCVGFLRPFCEDVADRLEEGPGTCVGLSLDAPVTWGATDAHGRGRLVPHRLHACPIRQGGGHEISSSPSTASSSASSAAATSDTSIRGWMAAHRLRTVG